MKIEIAESNAGCLLAPNPLPRTTAVLGDEEVKFSTLQRESLSAETDAQKFLVAGFTLSLQRILGPARVAFSMFSAFSRPGMASSCRAVGRKKQGWSTRAMKTSWRLSWMFLLWTLAASGLAQPASKLDRDLKSRSVSGMSDMGQVTLLAERGNFNAQFKVATACMGSRLYADALKWYSAAADQGVLEARYQKGRLLLYGCQGETPSQSVVAEPAEGIQFVYAAATNRHPAAGFDLARALMDGRGCARDRVTAYAWFSVCGEAGNASSRDSMNALALQLSPEDIRQALACAGKIKAGHWPALGTLAAAVAVARVVDIKLNLSGVTFSPRCKLAVINKRTLGEGESGQFMSNQKEPVSVTCQHIQPDFVEVLVAGEAQPRTLTIATR